jgi:hypothetical protein
MANDFDDSVSKAFAALGLSRGASTAAVKHAFKRLALEHHPDHNIGDDRATKRFREVCEAYAVLTGRPKRKPASIPRDPFANPEEPRTAPGTRTKHYHYPTPAEIAALGRPRPFHPLKTLAWICALALVGLTVLSILRERGGIPPEPAPTNPWVPHFLERMRRRF